jgi:hypothetical protein
MPAPEPPPTPSAMPLSRRRRTAVGVVLAAATLLAIASIFALWANRQVLDADNWADTSSAMLDDNAIRTQVAGYLVDQVYTNVDVGAEVGRALPPRFKPLAGPAANGLRDLAQTTTERALGRPRIQQAWKAANRITAQQFINIAEGKSGAITASGSAVVLDLRSMVVDLVARLGLPGTLAGKIPDGAGRIKIMSSSQVSTLQDGVSVLRGLGAILPALTVALLALAVYLARGRRRPVLLAAGLIWIAAGLIVLLARNIIGSQVVDSLASTDAAKPAADAAWSIGTRMLHDVAQASVVIGIPVVAAAWLAGPSRPAVALRRAAAPTLRDRPGIAYGSLAALLLLVIAWAPIPATRMLLPVLLMAVLASAGVAVLRRQTDREFPEVAAGEARAALQDRIARTMRAMQGDRETSAATAPVANGGTAPPPVAVASEARLDQLERLATLHDGGVLTDEEFAAEKAGVLTGGHA